MGRLAWSQVRFRLARTLALIAGVLVAATAFTVQARFAPKPGDGLLPVDV
jgi:hypothetical protein